MYRSPGVKSSEASLGDGTKRAYNYEALVDRWYQIYDTHYRMEPEPSQYDFQFQTYASVWDDNASLGAEAPSSIGGSSSGPGRTLDLDELRRLAVEGLSSFESSANAHAGSAPQPDKGEYRSMPLEGRVDLMRPRKDPELEQTAQSGQHGNDDNQGTPRPSHIPMPSDQGGYFMTHTLPTPAPNEIPPAPYHHGGSLPPTQTPTPYYGPSSQYNYPQPQSNNLQIFYPSQMGSESVTGPQQHFGHTSQPHPQTHASHSSHHHHRRAPSPVQQRTPWEKQDSSDSVRTPPGGHPYPHAPRHHHHHQQSGGDIHSPQPQHYGRPSGDPHAAFGGQQEQYHSPARGGPPQRGYETPPKHQYRAHHGHSSHSGPDVTQVSRHRRSGDHTPTQEQPWRVHGHYKSSRGQQQGQSHVHFQHPHAHHHTYTQSQARVHYEQPTPVSQRPEPHIRPSSPPKVSWNPAVEPPPRETPPASAFPRDTYFPNIWDQTPGQQHDAAYHSYPSQDDSTGVFFNPPPPPTIPDQLIREGQYSNVLGPAPSRDSPESVSSPPVPDKAKVHAVFPWEEKPRHVPRRIFPRTDTPPPAASYIESERTSSPISTPPTSVERVAPQVHTPSPLASPWTNVGFSNAWDAVPSIQRYASKLAGSPKIFPHQFMAPPPPPKDEDWKIQWEKEREKNLQERHDASSMDGDDEDDEDELAEEMEYSDGSRGKRSQSSRHKSHAHGRSKKKYRSRGTQASPETIELGIQCTIISASDIPPPHTTREVGTDIDPMACPTCHMVPAGVGLGIRRQMPAGMHQTLLPSVSKDYELGAEQTAGTPLVSTTSRSGELFPSLATPSGLRSPATVGSPRTYSPPRVASPVKIPTPPKVRSPPAVSSPLRGSSSPVVAPVPQSAPNRSPQMTTRPAGSPRKLSTSSVPGSGSSRAGSPVVGTAGKTAQLTPSPKRTRLSSLSTPQSPQLARSISTETAITASPTSTHDSPITPDTTPRRGSRVWDPARGVDVFKRGSEEVLARFLRMGSFDDEEGKRVAV